MQHKDAGFNKRLVKLVQSLYTWFGTNQAFILLLVLFGLSSLWIAIASRYPMAFDEDYHLGLIKFFSGHPNPWLTTQPLSADVYGAVVASPSYLYHYILALPWRAITALTDNFVAQVIALRVLNIGIFIGGVIVWRTVLLRTKLSMLMVNTILLLFLFTPVLVQIAGQINYDNLVFLGSGASILLTMLLLERSKKLKAIDIPSLLLFLSVGMATCLVKYAYAPIFIVLCVYIALRLIRSYGLKQTLHPAKFSYTQLELTSKLIITLFFALMSILFIQRYASNMATYHTPFPECDQVLSTQRCLSYSPWARNYQFKLIKLADYRPYYFYYIDYWVRHMVDNLLFVLNGPYGGYLTGRPLVVQKSAFVLLCVLALFSLPFAWQRLRKIPYFNLLAALTGLYGASLFMQNLHEYIQLGQPVAVQGRYLLPVLIPLYFGAIMSCYYALSKAPRLRTTLGVLLIVCFITGGGLLTFIVRSDATWYWDNSSLVSISNYTQQTIKTIVPGL